MKISLAMIVKNEEKYIERCINSVEDLVDEIVIVDTGSTDRTIDILRKYPNVHLYNFEWSDDFSAARNFSIEKTKGDYVLVLDADEYITEGSRDELELVMNQNYIGRLLIHSPFQKDQQTYESKEYVSRFFPREVSYTGVIHEQLNSDRPRVKININVKHDGYFNKNKGERNIPLLLREVKKNPSNSYYLFQLGKELRINKQYKEAFSFLNKAYVQIIKNSPYYNELVVELINSGKECSKEEVLEIIKQNDTLLKNIPDFHFAKGLFYLDYCLRCPEEAANYIPLIEKSFLECLVLNERPDLEIVKGTSSFMAAYNLGVFYEVTGQLNKALPYYKYSCEKGYNPAEQRFKKLSKLNQ
ncbi:glycosyltransferase family 2 protein [Domibacillus sp.]|uniref:glycosyltransferase family 2 protein n=1 Tax=Domibacillus sp. TaxID=1969783 RepID=UPI002811E1EE|nr:glycosyltransferase family 2 protein [Domibacillus sp.]